MTSWSEAQARESEAVRGTEQPPVHRPTPGSVSGPFVTPVFVLGEKVLVEGFALAGAVVVVAEDDESVARAWGSIPEDSVVVLTHSAAAALEARGVRLEGRLRAVMPT